MRRHRRARGRARGRAVHAAQGDPPSPRGRLTLRTLVISDLHLGARSGRDLLRRPEFRRPLLESLGEVDRLVLLGDVVELRQGPMREAFAAAAPVLEQIGGALAGAEVVLVPGNHDHGLLSGWLQQRALDRAPAPLGLESPVAPAGGDPLAVLAGWLAPAAVRVAYPGVWLREDVYATHGHYGDRHTTVPMVERLGAGAMARIAGEPPRGPARAEDYEAILAPLYAWIDAVAEHARGERRAAHGASASAWRALSRSGARLSVRRVGLRAAFPAVIAALNRAGIGPVRRDISGPELRRAALRAFGEAVTRLGVGADHVIFGHTHRAGPLPGDELSEWRTGRGSLLNTGCWIHEPAFLGRTPQTSPYRAGFAAMVGAGEQPPNLVNLLDGVATAPDRG